MLICCFCLYISYFTAWALSVTLAIFWPTIIIYERSHWRGVFGELPGLWLSQSTLQQSRNNEHKTKQSNLTNPTDLSWLVASLDILAGNHSQQLPETTRGAVTAECRWLAAKATTFTNLIHTTHAPETGVINRLMWLSFLDVCHNFYFVRRLWPTDGGAIANPVMIWYEKCVKLWQNMYQTYINLFCTQFSFFPWRVTAPPQSPPPVGRGISLPTPSLDAVFSAVRFFCSGINTQYDRPS